MKQVLVHALMLDKTWLVGMVIRCRGGYWGDGGEEQRLDGFLDVSKGSLSLCVSLYVVLESCIYQSSAGVLNT